MTRWRALVTVCVWLVLSVSLAATDAAPGGARPGRHRRGRFGGDPGDGRPRRTRSSTSGGPGRGRCAALYAVAIRGSTRCALNCTTRGGLVRPSSAELLSISSMIGCSPTVTSTAPRILPRRWRRSPRPCVISSQPTDARPLPCASWTASSPISSRCERGDDADERRSTSRRRRALLVAFSTR